MRTLQAIRAKVLSSMLANHGRPITAAPLCLGVVIAGKLRSDINDNLIFDWEQRIFYLTP